VNQPTLVASNLIERNFPACAGKCSTTALDETEAGSQAPFGAKSDASSLNPFQGGVDNLTGQA
jgi:hypothetical protein